MSSRWLAVSASARLDQHSEFGTFVSPRISGALAARAVVEPPVLRHRLLRADADHRGDRGRRAVAADRPRSAEGRTGRSASLDLTRTRGPLSATADAVPLERRNPVEVERTDAFVLRNLPAPTTNTRRGGARDLEGGGFLVRRQLRVCPVAGRPPTKAASTCR